MKLVIIDGQSGRKGALLAERIKAAKLPCEVLAVVTNATVSYTHLEAIERTYQEVSISKLFR